MSNAMTNEEAIRILDPDCKEVWKAYDDKDMERCNEACRAAVKALEYRIPKKPVIGDTFSEKFQKAIIKTGSNPDMVKGQSYKCPVCNHRIIMLWEVERNKRIYGWKCKNIFCNKCGQALDWSDEK